MHRAKEMTPRMRLKREGDWLLLGRGKSSEVFRIGNGEVVKIFHPAVSEEMFVREITAATLASSLGLPSGAPPRTPGGRRVNSLALPDIPAGFPGAAD